jgi:3-deoxy-D-manno-octulosonic-acid transferase
MPSLLAATLARLPLPLRLAAFRALERLAALRKPRAGNTAAVTLPAPGTPASLWVFVSTIGELNAIEPFLNRLHAALGQPPLLLISDRSHYGEAFRAKYPHAAQVCLQGGMAEASALARVVPPLLLLVAEIPCRLHDAPCRFGFASVHAAQRAGAPAVLVNGWLYGYTPPSRMDLLEHRLFDRDYLQAFDLMLVQTDAVRQVLISHGAAPERVAVTGNIKFDAMGTAYAAPAASPLRAALRRRAQRGPVIVAGSVTETADQRGLLEAFVRVLAAHPQALLVLAPRHPENQPRMAALRQLLQDSALPHRWRSACAATDADGANEAVDTSVLVLDTMGELRGCYAEATLSFVGTDHNVLEPLAFGKPVFVGPGWEATYPSFPVYQQLLAAGALHAVDTLPALGEAWQEALADRGSAAQAAVVRAEAVLAQARGAVERNMAALARSPVARLLTGPPRAP